MNEIQFEQLPSLFEQIAVLFNEKKEELCAMDAKLGDGDLGLTMSKGFSALPELLRDNATDSNGDLGKLLMKAGMKMSSLVPSTMGFLMSSGIMEGGKSLRGKTVIDASGLADYLEGFAAGLQKRGKCQVGQRTIYDSIKPAAEAARSVVANNPAATVHEVMSIAVDAAQRGVEATKEMTPVWGKAAVHAAQSAGIADQGAVAGYYMLLGMNNFLNA